MQKFFTPMSSLEDFGGESHIPPLFPGVCLNDTLTTGVVSLPSVVPFHSSHSRYFLASTCPFAKGGTFFAMQILYLFIRQSSIFFFALPSSGI